MIIPVRCYTCYKCIGHLHEEYVTRTGGAMPENPEHVLDSLGLRRTCCRRMLLTHADLSLVTTSCEWRDRGFDESNTTISVENTKTRILSDVR